MKKIILMILSLILTMILVSAYGSERMVSGENPETAGLTVAYDQL